MWPTWRFLSATFVSSLPMTSSLFLNFFLKSSSSASLSVDPSKKMFIFQLLILDFWFEVQNFGWIFLPFIFEGQNLYLGQGQIGFEVFDGAPILRNNFWVITQPRLQLTHFLLESLTLLMELISWPFSFSSWEPLAADDSHLTLTCSSSEASDWASCSEWESFLK